MRIKKNRRNVWNRKWKSIPICKIFGVSKPPNESPKRKRIKSLATRQKERERKRIRLSNSYLHIYLNLFPSFDRFPFRRCRWIYIYIFFLFFSVALNNAKMGFVKRFYCHLNKEPKAEKGKKNIKRIKLYSISATKEKEEEEKKDPHTIKRKK